MTTPDLPLRQLAGRALTSLAYTLAILLPSTHASAQPPSLPLQTALERALSTAPQLASVRAELRAAESATEQAGYRPNPELGLEAENVAGSGPYHAFDETVFTLTLSQEIELGNKRIRRTQAAQRAVTLVKQRLADEQLALIQGVTIAYVQLIAAQAQLELATERTTLAENLLDEVTTRVESALEPALQLNKAQIALARARLTEERLKREVQHSEHVLASFWLGRHERYSYDTRFFFELAEPVDEAVLESRLRRHPRIKRWHIEQDRQRALADLEKARAVPDANISLGVRQFQDSGDQALVLDVSMPLPVFNRNQGNIARAQATLERATSSEQSELVELTNLGLQALEDMTNAYHQASTLAKAIIPEAEQAFELAYGGFTAGRFSYLEVLDTQHTLSETKQSYIAALEDYHLAKAKLEYAMAAHLAPIDNPPQAAQD